MAVMLFSLWLTWHTRSWASVYRSTSDTAFLPCIYTGLDMPSYVSFLAALSWCVLHQLPLSFPLGWCFTLPSAMLTPLKQFMNPVLQCTTWLFTIYADTSKSMLPRSKTAQFLLVPQVLSAFATFWSAQGTEGSSFQWAFVLFAKSLSSYET